MFVNMQWTDAVRLVVKHTHRHEFMHASSTSTLLSPGLASPVFSGVVPSSPKSPLSPGYRSKPGSS